jgi:predicted nucleic acid-binding protein
MPGARIFIDSNTFLYTFDQDETNKQGIAQGWLIALAERDLGVTNLQVLNEVASVATRKSSRFVDPFFRIDSFAQFGTTPISFDTSLAARQIHASTSYSWWDCVLLASALELGCTHFLSEDLQDGQAVDGLTIVDPFAHSPQQILVSP